MEHMDFFQWHWWAGIAILMVIAEIFVPGFFLVCLGIGCVGASAVAALGFGPATQLITFSALSLVAFFTIRPILMKRMWKDNGVRTNVDALIGQSGRGKEDFQTGVRLGRVDVGGGEWGGESTTAKALHLGELGAVVRVENNTPIVETFNLN